MSATWIVILTLIFCSACVAPENEVATESSKTIDKSILTCSASPPVLDKGKIAKMLEKNGTITADMSEEQRMKVVNDFIKRKTKPRKECK